MIPDEHVLSGVSTVQMFSSWCDFRSLSDGPIQVPLKEKGSSGAQKRRIRAILPAPAQSSELNSRNTHTVFTSCVMFVMLRCFFTDTAVQSALVQWISVGPDEVKTDAGELR